MCRLILANKDHVPLNDVLPVIFKNLPLKEDHEEYWVVFSCFLQLLKSQHPLVMEKIGLILELACNMHDTQNDKTKTVIQDLVRAAYESDPTAFSNVASKLPTNVTSFLSGILS